MSLHRKISLFLLVSLLGGGAYVYTLTTPGIRHEVPLPLVVASPERVRKDFRIIALSQVNEGLDFEPSESLRIYLSGFTTAKTFSLEDSANSVRLLEIPKHAGVRISLAKQTVQVEQRGLTTIALYLLDPQGSHANISLDRKGSTRKILSKLGIGRWFYFDLRQRELDLMEIEFSLTKLTDNAAYIGAIALLEKKRADTD